MLRAPRDRFAPALAEKWRYRCTRCMRCALGTGRGANARARHDKEALTRRASQAQRLAAAPELRHTQRAPCKRPFWRCGAGAPTLDPRARATASGLKRGPNALRRGSPDAPRREGRGPWRLPQGSQHDGRARLRRLCAARARAAPGLEAVAADLGAPLLRALPWAPRGPKAAGSLCGPHAPPALRRTQGGCGAQTPRSEPLQDLLAGVEQAIELARDVVHEGPATLAGGTQRRRRGSALGTELQARRGRRTRAAEGPEARGERSGETQGARGSPPRPQPPRPPRPCAHGPPLKRGGFRSSETRSEARRPRSARASRRAPGRVTQPPQAARQRCRARGLSPSGRRGALPQRRQASLFSRPRNPRTATGHGAQAWAAVS